MALMTLLNSTFHLDENKQLQAELSSKGESLMEQKKVSCLLLHHVCITSFSSNSTSISNQNQPVKHLWVPVSQNSI